MFEKKNGMLAPVPGGITCLQMLTSQSTFVEFGLCTHTRRAAVCVPLCVCPVYVCISLPPCEHLGLLRALLSGCCFVVYMEEPGTGVKQGLKS